MALNKDKTPFGLDMEDRLKKQLFGNDKPTHTHTYTDIAETKSKRLYLLTKPSVHQKLDQYAKAHGDSFNNLVHTLMEKFIEENDL